jgi:Protein kinase domain
MTSPLADDLQRALGSAYSIERELGGGGMSRVFVAHEHALGRKVVVKMLPPDLVAGLSVERFRREIQLAAQLQHPNIVPVLATGDANGLPWFTMPFVVGESLRVRLTRDRALPVRDAIAILRDVASALEFAHALGIVHRDIKPDNVLLAGRAAVVTDFGIAKAISASRTVAPGGTLTQVGTSLGTPAYMAPEQAAGDPHTDSRADLYAWGVMAFELLAGRLPFTSSLAHELIRAHIMEPAPGLETLRADLPGDLVSLVARCLSKNPNDRPRDAAELVRVLEALPATGDTSRERVAAAPSPRIVSGTPRPRRWGPVIAAAAIVVAAGAGAQFFLGRQPSPEASAATVGLPAFDPALMLLVPPSPTAASLATAATLTTDALSRGFAAMRYAQVTVASAGSEEDHRAAAVAGRMATILDGRVTTTGDSVQVDLRLTDAATGRVILALPPMRVLAADPARGLDAALGPVMSAVALITNPLLGPATLPRGPLPALAAVRALEQALLQRNFNVQIEEMDRAVRADSAWTLSRVIRAARYFWYSQYYEDEARRRAMVAAMPGPEVPLSPYETALREAALAANDAAPEREAAAMRQVQLVAPSAFGGGRYTISLMDLNRPRAALAEMERLGPFARDPQAPSGSPLVESAAYWGTIAELHHYLGDYKAERAAAERSAQLAGVTFATLNRRGTAYAALGDSAAVERVLDAAYVMPSEINPNAFGGELFLIIGQELIVHGHQAHGEQVLERALRWFAEHRRETLPGDTVPRTDIAFREAVALRAAGRDADALAAVRPLAALRTSDTRFRSFYGRVQGAMGDHAAADSVDAWLGELQRDPAKAATSLAERAFLAAARGRKEEAVRLMQESFARGTTFYIRKNLHRFNDWWALRGYAPYDRLVTPEG